jgi:lipid A 3-O-deacylase
VKAIAMKTLILLLFFLPSISFASSLIKVSLGNDLFAPENKESDRYLTNSFRVQIKNEELPEFLEAFLPQDEVDHLIVNFSQDIYTPEDLEKETYQENDRPYAGHLYIEFKAIKIDEKSHDYTTLQIGIIGPMSLAEESQIAIHNLTESTIPKGWEHQLKNELGINISKFIGHKEELFRKGLIRIDSISYLEAGIGNVKTYTKMGNKLRAGYNPPVDFRIDELFKAQKSQLSLYVEADINRTFVVRDIFIDGNSKWFGDKTLIERSDYVTQIETSIVGRWKNWFLHYTHSYQGKSFKKQNGSQKYGTFSFGYAKKFD